MTYPSIDPSKEEMQYSLYMDDDDITDGVRRPNTYATLTEEDIDIETGVVPPPLKKVEKRISKYIS